ncbi:MAG: hypothetical protein ACUBOA_10160 [Candidatus Loosdrechtia sp.]|uniref:hypothetical protein n=1 Tax=Candidatus Loosdrechtia sp. TaxID=3101272 RepID=UPI003A7A82B8|nr:MAG: hypothetical protein QY305_11120 [Candidatus Jettenia sp. AMX2]
MSQKPWKEFFHKNLFSFVILASLAIHAVIILLSPWANQIFHVNSFRDSIIREPGSYAVILEFERESNFSKQTSEIQQVEKEIKEEKKYKIFTDTSDSPEDEDIQVDTDKIGEKGTVAKDNFPDDKRSVNSEPHSEGFTKTPLLGKEGTRDSPIIDIKQNQEHDTKTQVFVSGAGTSNNSAPPLYDHQLNELNNQKETTASSQTPLITHEKVIEKTEEIKTVEPDKTAKQETVTQTTKRERLILGRSIRQEETETPFTHEGMLFPDKQDEITNKSEIKTELLLEGEKFAEREQEMAIAEKSDEMPIQTKEPEMQKTNLPLFPSEMKDTEARQEFQRGLSKQENKGDFHDAQASFGVSAKTDSTRKEPVLFEDTISNAPIRGAPAFNVKKHEYADYFKHIRDKISLYWFLGYGTRAEIKLTTHNDRPIIIEFKVLPNGSIDQLKIVDDAGNFQLASRLVASIKKADPLNPFPPKIKEPSIDVRFNFHFF